MSEAVAVIAITKRLARLAAPCVRARLPGAPIRPFSLRGFLAARSAPRRIVLCVSGRSAASGTAFLRRARRRLLWPAPADAFEEAVGGIRKPRDEARAPSRRRGVPAGAVRIAAALLLEGSVGPARARAALASAGPRDWIVESASRVRVPDRLLEDLSRAGVRWSALEPFELLALCVSPGRSRPGWRRLLPARTPVWTQGSRRPGRPARRRRLRNPRDP
jgi:hypothetical protein